MRFVNAIVEGKTEMLFVKKVLGEYFGPQGIFFNARAVETSRDKNKIHRGGFRRGKTYPYVKKDIKNWLKQEPNPNTYFTTIFDLYALPKDFPQFQEATKRTNPYDKVTCLEQGLLNDIGDKRFLPYIQLHEFETLLLVSPEKLSSEFLAQSDQAGITQLVNLVKSFASPEEINEGKQFAPSKRIIQQIPSYKNRKASVGPSVAASIGIEAMRKKCPHFNDWLKKLENLGT